MGPLYFRISPTRNTTAIVWRMTRSAKHCCQRCIRPLALLFLFSCWGAAFAQPAGRLAIQPGETVERAFGPVTFLIHVSERLAQVTVEVELSGRLIGEHNLAPSDDTFRMDFLEGGTAVRGTLLAKFGYPQRIRLFPAISRLRMVTGKCLSAVKSRSGNGWFPS